MAYEAEKLANRHTAARCAAHGIRLVPMVVETLGGWGPGAQLIFKAIARATAQKSGVPDSVATAQLYQALGVRLQRANARAILSRTAAAAAGCANTTFATTSRSKAALVLTTAANAG